MNRYVAVIAHSHGQTHSSPMAARLALKVGKAWAVHAGQSAIRIECVDSGGSWPLKEFILCTALASSSGSSTNSDSPELIG